ncbi:MAG: hypothetical protein EOP87_00055 [Verrucomicrobiaceae bacterium]|nr:MAG: hypothetical protein EOP87_00055 [Verrucomicrobiaceae bacterium]
MPTNQEKHTPGPWLRDGKGAVRDAEAYTVAQVIYKRDAALIAAAPELLAELRGILSAVEGEGWSLQELRTVVGSRARAAIAKAEGK